MSGGFEGGSNAASALSKLPFTTYFILTDIACREPVENVVARSVELGHPIIAVSANYRLSGKRTGVSSNKSQADLRISLRVPRGERDEGSGRHEPRPARSYVLALCIHGRGML